MTDQQPTFDFMNLDGDNFLAKKIEEPAPPKLSKREQEREELYRAMAKKRLKNSLADDGVKPGYTGIMPAYSTASYNPITISQEIQKSNILKAYIQDGTSSTMKYLDGETKNNAVQVIRRFNLTKDSVIIADFCNGLYKYITNPANDRNIERLIGERSGRVEYFRLKLPYTTIRKLTYGEALVNEKGEFRRGAGKILHKHIEPALLDMITHKKGTPFLLTFKKGDGKEPSLYFRTPVLFEGVNDKGVVSLLADPDFFLVSENTQGGYITSDRYIPTLLGLYPLLILGHKLKHHGPNRNGNKPMPSPVTAYRYITALNCAFNGQKILGIQKDIDNLTNPKRINIRLSREILAQLFKLHSTKTYTSKDGELIPYIDFSKAIDYTDACGGYLWETLDYMGVLPELKQEKDADKIVLPAKSWSAQFLNEVSKNGFFVKCDSILHS